MKALVAVLVGCAATAAAQPVTRPCAVTVALAPDDVRAEIESWVAAEPRCVRELEVRVIPSGDGLYLEARDATGRVRDRIVPDAQAAAVLVVSWMADDTLGGVVPPEAPRAPSTVRAEADSELPGELGAHGPGRGLPIALTLGAIGGEHRAGVRAQVDLVTRGGWRFGLAGGVQQDFDGGGDPMAQARVVVGVQRALGRSLAVRAQIGAGVNVGQDDGDRMRDARMDFGRRRDPGATPAVDAAVFGVLRVSPQWSVVGGPVVEATPGGVIPGVFLGVQHGP